ncbi:MAG: flagellar biosynthesis protein FlgB [Oscillospiraceae bacterium]|nr:flagellar biosynthesis protein FlgB [Oscillospiraceae bacterium]
MDFLSSNSLLMLEKSMGFLWTKQAAVLDNISNAETPNYKAKVVTFEDSLRLQLERAAKTTDPRKTVRAALNAARPDVFEAQESARMDENGVNVTEQSTELVRNAYQLQYVFSALSTDLAVLRTAARGQ